MAKKPNTSPREEGGTQTLEREKLERPPLYEVLLHNDDYTTQEFVVYVLMKFFRKNRQDATQIMLHVHHKGIGVCGVYPHDTAETKVVQVTECARENGMPLKCTMRKAP
jgi:ATP-dependent Clp protease adaptor protein ClpS